MIKLKLTFLVMLISLPAIFPAMAQYVTYTEKTDYKGVFTISESQKNNYTRDKYIVVSDSTAFFQSDYIILADGSKIKNPYRSSALENPYKFKGTELIAPGVLLGIGIVGLENGWWKKVNREIRDDFQKNDHKNIIIDDYMQFLPAVASYGLKFCGVKGLHDLVDYTIIFGTAYALLAATLYPTKFFVKCKRPNGHNYHSFPSGHTAFAFTGAELLRREYWHVSPWIGISGYLVATATGFLRIYNNAHWLNDVIAGAGLGILCAEAAYWLYPALTKAIFKKRYKNNIYLAPAISEQSYGLACSFTF